MSINDPLEKDNELTEDEAFIQSLYDDLSKQDAGVKQTYTANTAPEQPSKDADNKILAAAHRAVRSAPKAEVKKIGKKHSWYIPLASAASLVLVFSLFIKQLNTPLIQPSNLESIQPLAESNDSEQLLAVEEISQLTDEPAQSMYKQAHKQEKPSAVKQKSKQSSNEMKRAFSPVASQSLAKKEQQLADEQAAGSLRLHNDNLLIDNHAASLVADKKSIPYLSKKRYELLLSEKYNWIFISEEKEYYVIQLVSKEGKNTLYKLNKTAYYINKSMQKNKVIRSLKVLEILTEN